MEDYKSVNQLFKILSMVLGKKFNGLDNRTKSKAINKGIYALRAQILAKYKKFDPRPDESTLNILTLDCDTDVTELAEFLFQQFPSVYQIKTCHESRCKQLIIPQVSVDHLTSSTFRDDFSTLLFKTKTCKECNAIPHSELYCGKDILLYLYKLYCLLNKIIAPFAKNL